MKKRLPKLLGEEDGGVVGNLVACTLTTPLCAWIGYHAGSFVGYLDGHFTDFIPLIKDVVPSLIEKYGLIQGAKDTLEINKDVFQTLGKMSGFTAGAIAPWKMWSYAIKAREKK